MNTVRALVALPVLVALAASPTLADSASRSVTMLDFAYLPSPLYAEVGDAVTFTNEDLDVHTATCYADQCAWETEFLQQGESDTITLMRAGTQVYFCILHGAMEGTVFAGSLDPADPDLALDPASLRVERPVAFAVGPVSVPQLDGVTIEVDVLNLDPEASQATTVAFSTYDALGERVVIGTATVPAFAGRVTVAVDWPDAPLAGEATLEIALDPANSIAERVESNNYHVASVAPGLLGE